MILHKLLSIVVHIECYSALLLCCVKPLISPWCAYLDVDIIASTSFDAQSLSFCLIRIFNLYM